MSVLGVLKAVAPLLSVVFAGLVASRRMLVRRFVRADATAPARSVDLPPQRRLGRYWLGRLQQAGVLRALPSGGMWLDTEKWAAYRSVRRKRALLVLAVALVALFMVLRASG
jgi:hypothetical protein